jgi:hypothetical protein
MCSVFSIECFLYTCSFQWASGHLDDDCGGSSCNGSAAVGESSGSKPLKPLFESRGPRTCMHAYASTTYACTTYASSMPNIRVPSDILPHAVQWSSHNRMHVHAGTDKPSASQAACNGVQRAACNQKQRSAAVFPICRRIAALGKAPAK